MIKGLYHTGKPTTKEWVMLLLDVPEYWNRVTGVIEDSRNEGYVLPDQETVNRLINIHRRFRIPVRLFWNILLPIASFFMGGFLLT